MARTTITAVQLTHGIIVADAAEVSAAIDAANGMRVVPVSQIDKLAIRITNTHASPHQVTVRSSPSAGNSRGVYGAAGPQGSNPSEPNFVSVAIPATTGVRWISPAASFFQSDGSFLLDFEAAHTGTITVVEIP